MSVPNFVPIHQVEAEIFRRIHKRFGARKKSQNH